MMTFPSFPSQHFADADIFDSLLTEVRSQSPLAPLSFGLMSRVLCDIDCRSFLSETTFLSSLPLLSAAPQAKDLIGSLFAHPRELPDELFQAFLPGIIDLIETGDATQSPEVLLLVVEALDAGCEFADDLLRGLIDRHLDAEVVPLLVRRLADPSPYFEWLVDAIDDDRVAAGCLIGCWDKWTFGRQRRLADVIRERLAEWNFEVKTVIVAGICAIEDPALFASEDVFEHIIEFTTDSGHICIAGLFRLWAAADSELQQRFVVIMQEALAAEGELESPELALLASCVGLPEPDW
jgi:hypothetical protein